MPFSEVVRPHAMMYGSPVEGSFAIEPETINGFQPATVWETCRERFGMAFQSNIDSFLFAAKCEHRRIADFIDQTDKILGIAGIVASPTFVGSTERKDIMYVQPSQFWRDCYMKRSLFTILLRAGLKYQNSYQEALKLQEYSLVTMTAVHRFLFGFTKYTGNVPSVATSTANQGWVHIFRDRTDEEIRRLLVSGEPDRETTRFGSGSLWR